MQVKRLTQKRRKNWQRVNRTVIVGDIFVSSDREETPALGCIFAEAGKPRQSYIIPGFSLKPRWLRPMNLHLTEPI
jgi:hypothetical protein